MDAGYHVTAPTAEPLLARLMAHTQRVTAGARAVRVAADAHAS